MGVFLTTAYRTYLIGIAVFVVAAKTVEFVKECKKDEKIMKFWNNLKKDISKLGFEKRESKNV